MCNVNYLRRSPDFEREQVRQGGTERKGGVEMMQMQ